MDDDVDIKPKLDQDVKSKPIKKSTKYEMYHIVWRDAFSEHDQWHDASSISRSDYICETVGFLLKNNKKPEYVTIASTITHDGYFCSVMNIPKNMIISQDKL